MTETKESQITMSHASFILAILPFIGRFLRGGKGVDKTIAQIWVFGSALLALLAVILGIIVIAKMIINKRKEQAFGFSIAGIIIGGFQILIFVGMTLLMILNKK